MNTVRHTLIRLEQRLGQVALAGLPDVLCEYARTGVLPEDPLARAYVDTWRAFDAMADRSIGGGEAEYEAAMATYMAAVRDYRSAIENPGILA